MMDPVIVFGVLSLLMTVLAPVLGYHYSEWTKRKRNARQERLNSRQDVGRRLSTSPLDFLVTHSMEIRLRMETLGVIQTSATFYFTVGMGNLLLGTIEQNPLNTVVGTIMLILGVACLLLVQRTPNHLKELEQFTLDAMALRLVRNSETHKETPDQSKDQPGAADKA